jgi:predicted nuclease of predicted toxin-antitoxin system
VRFIVDAQLPARLAMLLTDAGHDAVHTSQLPAGNRTTDGAIAELADGGDRVVVTKDRDFRDGHLLGGSSRRLLVVGTGNITNAALLALFGAHLTEIVAAFDEVDFVELRPTALILHGGAESTGNRPAPARRAGMT